MNLSSLADRHPAMFPRPEKPRKRGNGSKKRNAWAARFAGYRDAFVQLVFRFDIAAERERLLAVRLAEARDQLAQTGGIERGSLTNG